MKNSNIIIIIFIGSWDGSARIWEINETSITCTAVLPGHENGVCVLGLPDGSIVTGSTGEQKENTVVNFKLRFWSNTGTLLKEIYDHQGKHV